MMFISILFTQALANGGVGDEKYVWVLAVFAFPLRVPLHVQSKEHRLSHLEWRFVCQEGTRERKCAVGFSKGLVD
jgi:hypothetical protein